MLNVGTLEKIECPNGYVQSVTPKYLPGGQIITHLEVQCSKVEVQCR